jgi:undecaprenyl pyrophosphate phosphatase UppP
MLFATIPVILGFLLYGKISFLSRKLIYVAAFLLINGIILYVPQYLPGSNKASGAMNRVDALLVGLGGAAATLPGVSCIGTAVSIASIRGMDTKKALSLALLMNIPVNLGFAFFDLMQLLSGGAGSLSLSALFGAVLAGITAFCGVILGIRLLQKIADSVGFSVFGFYSWGTALLTFIFFLATV